MRKRMLYLAVIMTSVLVMAAAPLWAEETSVAATDAAVAAATPTFYAVAFKGVDRKMIGEILPMVSKELLDIPFELLESAPDIPKEAYEEVREKYYAGAILDYLETLMPKGGVAIIGFVNEPIFAGPSPFVDGVGLPDKGAAIVSLAQLKEVDYYRFRRRAFSEALHEMGHVAGLDHDPKSYCVMQDTHDKGQLDARETSFCPFHLQNAYKFLSKKIPNLKPVDPYKGKQKVPPVKSAYKEDAEKKEKPADIKPPELLDIYPNEGAMVTKDIGYIRARLVDQPAGAGVDPMSILLLVDGAQLNFNYTEATGELTARLRDLDPGIHSVELHASDKKNNSMNPFFFSFIVNE
ncbi:MAG: archaemetzincin [bacterium]